MPIESVAEEIKKRSAAAPPLNATVKFDLGEDGVILFDSHAAPGEVRLEDGEAVTTFTMSIDTLQGLLSGGSPTMAYMTGKLKIQGSMGVAMKLNAILED